MAIAFLPIEIDVQLPDPQIIFDYLEKYQIKTKHTSWRMAPILGRAPSTDWYDSNAYPKIIYNRYNSSITDIPQYANGIDKLMPEIPYMLNQLPFKTLTYALFLEQLEEVTKHNDMQIHDVCDDPSEIAIEHEPRRFNFLLTRHSEKAFFVSESMDAEKIYPIITKEHPCFAFNEQQYLHGADYIGPGKIIIMAGGLLDRKKHKKMIEENLEKFKNHVIRFSDPIIADVKAVGSGIE
jgi:hypothetical protein